ncbi:MAG TPA: sialidase family protein [Longimicrobium sp.]|nr:sialidase family protein [Longimicrobium sp.]
MNIRINIPAVALFTAAAAGCEQSPVRALPAESPAAALIATDGGAPIYGGTQNDYQPSLIRTADGRLMIVLERLAARTNSGDLYVSTSSDGGASWSVPAMIVGNSKLNERHPSLVQHASGGYSLFYLVADTKGAYSIHRATSANGTAWTQHGAINLGWGTAGDMNPSVIIEGDGSLTMTYQRSNGSAYVGYIARSTDGGATWDALRTTVSDGASGMLPRVAKRASDGLYMVTFQATGPGGLMAIYAKTSANPYSWSVPRAPVSEGENAHDSQPIVLEDGRFFVTYGAVRSAAGFNLYSRTTTDGAAWNAPVQLTTDSNLYDVQPHPILHGTPGHVILSWGRQRAAGSDYDIWVNRDLTVQ